MSNLLNERYRELAAGIVLRATLDFNRDAECNSSCRPTVHKQNPIPFHQCARDATRFFNSEWGKYLLDELDISTDDLAKNMGVKIQGDEMSYDDEIHCIVCLMPIRECKCPEPGCFENQTGENDITSDLIPVTTDGAIEDYLERANGER